MRDQIYIKDYRKSIDIGAFQEERAVIQELSFHVALDLHPQRTTMDIVDDIVSYDVIVNAVDDVLAQKRYNLLETMAEDIAANLLSSPQIASVSIQIEKLDRIDGKLGIHIIRHASAEKSETHLQITNAKVIAVDALSMITSLDPYQIIIPIFRDFPNHLETERRIYSLQSDCHAWRIAQSLNCPVVDSKVEALSLLARGHRFVRALGKQPFDILPPLETFDLDHLLNWHKAQLGVLSIENHISLDQS